jgi:endoglucanase
MNQESKNFLFKLLKTHSPTGYETAIQKVVRKRMDKYAQTMETDLHGNLIVGINTKAKRRVMLAGHCDQIGFMVRHIDKNGFIYVEPLGGIDTTVLWGTTIAIHGNNGVVHGVFGKRAIHLILPEERVRPKIDLNNMWVDIGAKDKKDAEKKVTVGDSATFVSNILELGKDLICAPGLDDKAGLFVVMEALRLCAKSKLSVALYAVSTVQEEVGLRGARTAAYSIDPEVGIAVDVTHSSDDPGAQGKKSSPCELGKGPGIEQGPNINPVLHKMLLASAKKHRIPHQPLTSGRLLGNDANAMQVNRAGVAAASLGLPNRNMHTQTEIVSLKDLENSAKLLAHFIRSIGERTNFRPR